MMCEPFRRIPPKIGQSILSAEVTRVRQTAQPVDPGSRVSRVSSSGLLMSFARALWSERIRCTSGRTLHGLGGDSVLLLSRLVTLCCPSDFERVALGLTTEGTDCSCSPKMPTPTATDWKGGHDRHAKCNQWNMRDWWRWTTGRRYLPIEVLTAVQGFPATWTELERSETP